MKTYELTGGARIGRANATFPFAKLSVSKDKLELNVTIIGNLVFTPSDIISIKPYQQVPLIGSGLKITHRVSTYKDSVIFWTFEHPEKVIKEIRKTGFFDNSNTELTKDLQQIRERQQQGGSPIKKSFAIGAVIVWNLLFALEFYNLFINEKAVFGYGMKTAFGLLLGTAILALLSNSFRKLILKEGRGLEDIKTLLYFIIVLCSLFILSFVSMTNIE